MAYNGLDGIDHAIVKTRGGDNQGLPSIARLCLDASTPIVGPRIGLELEVCSYNA